MPFALKIVVVAASENTVSVLVATSPYHDCHYRIYIPQIFDMGVYGRIISLARVYSVVLTSGATTNADSSE